MTSTETPAIKLVEERPKAKPRQTAHKARMRRRHWMVWLSFTLMVLAPLVATFWYLTQRASPQFSSEMSFSVRSEEFSNPLDALSGLGQLSTGTTADADIVYEFISSQKIVRDIDAQLGLRRLYAGTPSDPVFSISDNVSVEELVRHWRWMVQNSLDKGSGLIHVESFAFDADAAQQVNKAILNHSQQLVDRLSLLAREDATKYAEADLNEARSRLKQARQRLSQFRAESRVIDPTLAVQSQGGVSAALQQQLAEALIDYDLLSGSTSNRNDSRIQQSQLRIEAIRSRLESERAALSSGVDSGMVSIIGDYEALIVEREFAEQAFLAAAAAYDGAKADAKRRTKYLAVHIEPTLADSALYPRSPLIIGITALLLTLFWAVAMMVSYSIRDRR